MDNLTIAGGKTYRYDFANRLTSVTGSSGNAAMTYDPSGMTADDDEIITTGVRIGMLVD
ncbi:hypothetical protein [Litorimonas taeanensis]|uniref:hypothetical protein n=1 Tax=Litorimonas taeanensis TaxID=568099 RepID=UPI0014751E99|nr:hypothetical protein [Litorimonas taeanensis]